MTTFRIWSFARSAGIGPSGVSYRDDLRVQHTVRNSSETRESLLFSQLIEAQFSWPAAALLGRPP